MKKTGRLLLTLGLILFSGTAWLSALCIHQGKMYFWHRQCNSSGQECGAVLNYNCSKITYNYCYGKDGERYLLWIVKETPCPQPTCRPKKFEIPKGWKYLKGKETQRRGVKK